MISEKPLIDFVELEIWDPVTSTWTPWAASVSDMSIRRGGTRSGATSSVEVGSLTATLVNAGDPLTDPALKPNLPVRVIKRAAETEDGITPEKAIFTGNIFDIRVNYQVDKTTGTKTSFVNFYAVDAVSAHASTTRFGAITAGGLGQESWAARIARLTTSSTTPVANPADDAPIVKYAI